MSRYDRVVEMSAQPDGTYMVKWEGGGTKGHSAALSRREAIQVRQSLAKEGYEAHTGPCPDDTQASEPEPTMGCCVWVAVGALGCVWAIAGAVVVVA